MRRPLCRSCPPLVSTGPSVLGTQYSVPSTRYPVLVTTHRFRRARKTSARPPIHRLMGSQDGNVGWQASAKSLTARVGCDLLTLVLARCWSTPARNCKAIRLRPARRSKGGSGGSERLYRWNCLARLVSVVG